MGLPRGRIVTLSPYEARQTLPVRIHTGDSLDFTFNFVRLLRLDETPAEMLSAASASGRGVDVSNVEFEGRYMSLTISGARDTGQALISIAVSTDQGRTISRSLIVNTVYEELTIDPVIPDTTPPSACQEFTFNAATSFDGVEEGVFFHTSPEFAGRKAFGVGAYESLGTLDTTSIYDAEILYFGEEARFSVTDEGAVLALVLEGNLPQNYFTQIEIPEAWVGFSPVPLLSTSATSFGQDGDGNTYWTWEHTLSSGGPWMWDLPLEFSVDCDL